MLVVHGRPAWSLGAWSAQGCSFSPLMGGKRQNEWYFPPISEGCGGKISGYFPPISEGCGGKIQSFSPHHGGEIWKIPEKNPLHKGGKYWFSFRNWYLAVQVSENFRLRRACSIHFYYRRNSHHKHQKWCSNCKFEFFSWTIFPPYLTPMGGNFYFPPKSEGYGGKTENHFPPILGGKWAPLHTIMRSLRELHWLLKHYICPYWFSFTSCPFLSIPIKRLVWINCESTL